MVAQIMKRSDLGHIPKSRGCRIRLLIKLTRVRPSIIVLNLWLAQLPVSVAIR